MKRLFYLPLVLLFSCAQDSVEPLNAETHDFRKGDWFEAKATVLARDIAPASDEGTIVIMPFSERNHYDVYEFQNNALVGGLVKGSDIAETYDRLVKAHGAPLSVEGNTSRWETERTVITFHDHGNSLTVYYTPR